MVPLEVDGVVGVEKWKPMALKMSGCLRDIADGFPRRPAPDLMEEVNKFLDSALQMSRERLFGLTPHLSPGEYTIFESAFHDMRLAYVRRPGREADDFDRELITLIDFLGCRDDYGFFKKGLSKTSFLQAAAFFAALAALSDE